MKLLIDGSGFIPAKALGAQTYLEGVLGALDERPDHETLVVCGPAAGAYLRPKLSSVRVLEDKSIPAVAWRRLIWGRRNLPELVERAQPDVVFFPLNIAHPVPAPALLMVHDLMDLFYIRNFPRHEPIVHRVRHWVVERGVHGVDRIITPSRAVAEEVASTWPEVRERVVAIPEAVMPRSTSSLKVRSLERHSPDAMWLLVPSHYGPHKNAAMLVDALARVTEQRPDLKPRLRLIFTGRRTSDFSQLELRARQRGVHSLVTQTGFLSRPELDALYDAVDAVVYPSLYEGFGLPVVEAQAVGKPLLLSDIPVLREISRGDARFFKPTNDASLDRELLRLIEDLDRHLRTDSKPPPMREWAAYVDDLLLELETARSKWT